MRTDQAIAPTRARLILLGLLAILVAGFLSPPKRVLRGTPGHSDAALFQTVVERVKTDGYYQAMGAEMRARHYPLRSVFNWRLPTLYVGLAHAKTLILGILWVSGALVVFGTMGLTARWGTLPTLFVLALQFGASLAVATQLWIFSETWAGLCLALAVLAYARRQFVAGAIIIVAALFVRELVAPFALVAGCIAIGSRRWREVTVFAIGAVLVLAFSGWHFSMAQGAMLPTDPAQPISWIQFGGLGFLLSTIRFGGWLLVMPWWVGPVALVLLVASLWSPAPVHLKAAVVTYVVFFCIVGQPMNRGWGLLTAPTFAPAYGFGVFGVKTLWSAAMARVEHRVQVYSHP